VHPKITASAFFGLFLAINSQNVAIAYQQFPLFQLEKCFKFDVSW
jgi:hypothetical protein